MKLGRIRFWQQFRDVFVAAPAIGLQGGAALGAMAAVTWLSPVEQAGRFALFLTILSFATAIDACRHISVVVVSRNEDNTQLILRGLSAWSIAVGTVAMLLIFSICRAWFSLVATDAAGIAMVVGSMIIIGTGLGYLEGRRGPILANWLLATALAIGIAAAAVAQLLGYVVFVPWFLLFAPLICFLVLLWQRSIPLPSIKAMLLVNRRVASNLASHLVTAVAASIDRGVAATWGGMSLMGIYAPAAEVVARLSSLIAVCMHFLLRSEAANADHDQQPVQTATAATLLTLATAAVAVLIALFSGMLIQLLYGRAVPEAEIVLRILAMGLVANALSSRAAVLLKARMEFSLYPPYLVSSIAALCIAPMLLSLWGVVGVAVALLIANAGGLALIWRAKQWLGKELFMIAAGAEAMIGTIFLLT